MDLEKKPDENRPPVIRTMRMDAELYAKEKKLSGVQISASVYASQRPSLTTTDKKPLPKLIVLGVAAIVCVIIFGGGVWWILSSKNNNAQIREVLPPPAIVPVEGENMLSLKQEDTATITKIISAEYGKTFRLGALIYYPIKTGTGDNVAYINTKDFARLLNWHTPDSLLGTLAPDFNLFIFAGKQSNDFAIVLQAANFERAFSSMLEWERTLARDWQNILDSKNTSVAFPSAFQDEIIKNQDARILKKDDGSVVIGYVIFNKKYIVISTSREALGTVVDRLILLPPR